MVRRSSIALILGCGLVVAMPDGAEAQEPMASNAVVETLAELWLEGELVRLAEPAPTRLRSGRARLSVPAPVHFFGRGIDISTELTGEPRDGSVLLALKPKFSRQGGLLRCTFRF